MRVQSIKISDIVKNRCFLNVPYHQFLSLHFHSLIQGAVNKANTIHYSFKIFHSFWLTKIPRLIHHNWLLSTKFGRILQYWTDDVYNRAAKLTDYWTVNLEELHVGTSKSWYGGQYKMVEHFNCFRTKCCLTTIIARIARRQLNGWHLLFGVYLQTWTARHLINFPLNMHDWDELNIDRGKLCLGCF